MRSGRYRTPRVLGATKSVARRGPAAIEEPSVVGYDSPVTPAKSTVDDERAGQLGLEHRAAMDRALRGARTPLPIESTARNVH